MKFKTIIFASLGSLFIFISGMALAQLRPPWVVTVLWVIGMILSEKSLEFSKKEAVKK